MNKIYTDEEVDQIVKRRLERAKKVHNAEIYKAKEQAETTAMQKFTDDLLKLKTQISKQKKIIEYYEMMESARALLAKNNITINDDLLKELYSISGRDFPQSRGVAEEQVITGK